MVMDPIILSIAGTVLTAITGMISYLIKTTFDEMKEDLKELKLSNDQRQRELNGISGEMIRLTTVLQILDRTLNAVTVTRISSVDSEEMKRFDK